MKNRRIEEEIKAWNTSEVIGGFKRIFQKKKKIIQTDPSSIFGWETKPLFQLKPEEDLQERAWREEEKQEKNEEVPADEEKKKTKKEKWGRVLERKERERKREVREK